MSGWSRDSWSFRADRCATPAVFARGGGLVTTRVVARSARPASASPMRDGRAADLARLPVPRGAAPLRRLRDAPPRPTCRRYQLAAGRVASTLDVRESGRLRRARCARGREHVRRSRLGLASSEAAELAACGLYRWHYQRRSAAADRDGGVRSRRVRRDGRPRQHARVVGERRAVCLRAAAARPARRQRRLRRGRGGGARPHRRQPDAGRHVLGAVDARARLDVGLASRSLRALHARTLADATLFMLARRRRAGTASARSNVAVAVRTQREDGALPAAHHIETGDAVSLGGTAGMAWIPALVEAGELDEARRAGAYYRAVRRVVRRAGGRRPRTDAPRTATPR